jgi:hypothetical protein
LPGGSFIRQVLEVDDVGVGHLVIEVVAFAGALTDAGEHGQARVRLRDVVDQLHHVDGLADAGAAEQADLAALGERADQVDDLDAGLEQLLRGAQLVVRRRLAVDLGGQRLVDRAAFVDRVAQDVHDAAEGGLADRHRDARAGVAHHAAAAQAVGRAQRDRAHDAVAQLLLDFERQRGAVHLQRVIDVGHLVARKLDVDHGADGLNDLAHGSRSRHLFSLISRKI